MSLGATIVASLLATLARPTTWVLALVAFLVRGGLIVVLAPIVVIPSAVGLANVVAPTLNSMVLSGLSSEVLAFIALAIVAVGAWLVVGGFLAATMELAGMRLVAADEEVVGSMLPGPGPSSHPRTTGPAVGTAIRILLARLLASIPLALALALGAIRIVAVAYRELTVPSDVAVPVAVRIARGAPDAVALIVAAWIVAEIVGAVAARRVAIHGQGLRVGLIGAISDVVRHPVRVLVAFMLPLLALIAVLVPSTAAAVVTWDAVRTALSGDPGPLTVGVLVLLFVALWTGGLVLTGMVAAWRSALWTVEVTRTFGGVSTGRPGGWNPAPDSATLSDLRSREADPDPR